MDFLTKPVDDEILFQAIHEALARQSWQDALSNDRPGAASPGG